MLVVDTHQVSLELGNWVLIHEQNFHFQLKFIFDRLSMPFVILSYVLCGTVGAFTNQYLHREEGYHRFYVCFAIFTLGMILSSVAGTIGVLFLGWELVGLSSALLVAFFHERPSPVRNGLRVWAVYRFADAAFLMAAVAMHHMTGAGDFEGMVGKGSWPDGEALLTSNQALVVGLLLLIAAAGKSALVPFSGWLPRAMEGPTPSSAIFYGALSIHLGVFLLLRVSPLIASSLPLSLVVITLGLVTAAFAAMATHVQTDIKSALAFAALSQVGIIVVEIGLGLNYIALVHILGHACLRTLQLLRAPSLLHDYEILENNLGGRLSHTSQFLRNVVPASTRAWWYRFALERGYLDAMIDDYLIRPFQRIFQWCDRMERRWTDSLAGSPSRESDRLDPRAEVVEELRI
jgi:NAD(P)H-quinone oxidoreductase subunit 5